MLEEFITMWNNFFFYSSRSELYRHYSNTHFKQELLNLAGDSLCCFLCKEMKSRRNIITHLGVDHDYVDQFLPKEFHIASSRNEHIEKKFSETSVMDKVSVEGKQDLSDKIGANIDDEFNIMRGTPDCFVSIPKIKQCIVSFANKNVQNICMDLDENVNHSQQPLLVCSFDNRSPSSNSQKIRDSIEINQK